MEVAVSLSFDRLYFNAFVFIITIRMKVLLLLLTVKSSICTYLSQSQATKDAEAKIDAAKVSFLKVEIFYLNLFSFFRKEVFWQCWTTTAGCFITAICAITNLQEETQ